MGIKDLRSHTLQFHLKRLIQEMVLNQNDYSVVIASNDIYKLRQKIERESYRNYIAQAEYWVTHYEGDIYPRDMSLERRRYRRASAEFWVEHYTK